MTEDHVERRGFVRVDVYLEKLQVTVGVLGFEPTNGVVLNVSHGGMKVSLNGEISDLLLGDECLVRFVEAGRVDPEAKLGKLRRMEADGEYAIQFAEPLEALWVANGEQDSES